MKISDPTAFMSRRDFAIKIASSVLAQADAIISGWTPEPLESDALFRDRCLAFVATMTINAYEGAMSGVFDETAKQPTIIKGVVN